ncbi:MAG: hypothetical protein WCE83_08640 [Candidatus Baltobacteraceae bacterium]
MRMSRMVKASKMIKIVPGMLAALAAAALALPAVALAQDVPSYADAGYGNADETVHGRVDAIDGTFDLRLDDDRGFVDHVHLHQGTIINPTGLTLAPGMSVTILGYNAGSVLEANEIDTPYTYDGPAPVPVYYGPGWWYPGYDYGYGPSFSLALIFGGGGWSYARQPWGGRWYDERPLTGYQNGGLREPLRTGTRSYGTEPGRVAPEARTSFQAPSSERFPQSFVRSVGSGGTGWSGSSGFSRGGGPSYSGAPQASYHGGPAAFRGGTAAYRRSSNGSASSPGNHDVRR